MLSRAATFAAEGHCAEPPLIFESHAIYWCRIADTPYYLDWYFQRHCFSPDSETLLPLAWYYATASEMPHILPAYTFSLMPLLIFDYWSHFFRHAELSPISPRRFRFRQLNTLIAADAADALRRLYATLRYCHYCWCCHIRRFITLVFSLFSPTLLSLFSFWLLRITLRLSFAYSCHIYCWWYYARGWCHSWWADDLHDIAAVAWLILRWFAITLRHARYLLCCRHWFSRRLLMLPRLHFISTTPLISLFITPYYDWCRCHYDFRPMPYGYYAMITPHRLSRFSQYIDAIRRYRHDVPLFSRLLISGRYYCHWLLLDWLLWCHIRLSMFHAATLIRHFTPSPH